MCKISFKEDIAKNHFNLNDDKSPFLLKVSKANNNMINNIINTNDKNLYKRIVPLK